MVSITKSLLIGVGRLVGNVGNGKYAANKGGEFVVLRRNPDGMTLEVAYLLIDPGDENCTTIVEQMAQINLPLIAIL